MLKALSPEDALKLLLGGKALLDVRAPIEFKEGSIPDSVNIAILNDDERALVGTEYKTNGSVAATMLGHQLVSGANKAFRLEAWVLFFKDNPDGFLTCFRGGQRSQITQQWLKDFGIDIPRVEGGYKEVRKLLTEALVVVPERLSFQVLGGPTGSGKTRILRKLKKSKTLDLEKYAGHRGSAFGAESFAQPSQATFENKLAMELLKISKLKSKAPVVIEDESRMIGKCTQPLSLFDRLRASPVVIVDEPLASRVQLTFEDYILQTPIGLGNLEDGRALYAKYEKSLQLISKKLGGLRFSEIQDWLQQSQQEFLSGSTNLEINKEWIGRILEWYYDPLYERGLSLRKDQVVFQGDRAAVFNYLQSLER